MYAINKGLHEQNVVFTSTMCEQTIVQQKIT